MIDYEDLILQRQELQEIWEDDPEYYDKWEPQPKITHRPYIDTCVTVPAILLEYEEE